eukprot:6178348-Pleurochrysis_carterae.AAC.1
MQAKRSLVVSASMPATRRAVACAQSLARKHGAGACARALSCGQSVACVRVDNRLRACVWAIGCVRA